MSGSFLSLTKRRFQPTRPRVMPASIRSSLGSRHPRPIDDGKQRKVVVVPRADAGYCDDATLVCACCGKHPGVYAASPATLVADRPGPWREKRRSAVRVLQVRTVAGYGQISREAFHGG